MAIESHGSLAGRWSPWSEQVGAALVTSLRGQVLFDGIAVAVAQLDRPSLDEMLFTHGLDGGTPGAMLSGSFMASETVQRAISRGTVTVHRNGQSLASPLAGESGLVAMVPESLAERRWWLLLLQRKVGRFTDADARVADLWLRSWQVHCHQREPATLGRLILGHDRRLILADVDTLTTLTVGRTDWIRELASVLEPTVRQRYPKLPIGEYRDAVLSVHGKPLWLRFRVVQPLEAVESQQFQIELREADPRDLPAVGVVEDQRVADAIAWLHEHFAESPSLSDVARHVHTSPFHFHRLFSRQVGVSPKQYLQKRQLQIAKWLLRSRHAPIGEVAQRTGFSSHGHFTSTFHRLVGQSPSDYRAG